MTCPCAPSVFLYYANYADARGLHWRAIDRMLPHFPCAERHSGNSGSGSVSHNVFENYIHVQAEVD